MGIEPNLLTFKFVFPISIFNPIPAKTTFHQTVISVSRFTSHA